MNNKKIPTVLFVCVHNSCRSQMAEGFFNNLSKTGLAISAGANPSEKVNSNAVKVMHEIGIDISKNKPKILTQTMINESDKVVIVCGDNSCPFIPGAEKWGINDPEQSGEDEFRKIRDQIKEKVISLIDRLT